MAMKPTDCDREFDKFVETSDGETSVRTFSLAGFGIGEYDYFALVVSPATVETYTFKTGGSGGTTVGVIVLTYTDATKALLVSGERTS